MPSKTVYPTAGQRGRSPEHAAARVLPDGFADDLPSSPSAKQTD